MGTELEMRGMFLVLDVDYAKIRNLMAQHGDAAVFGTWSDWDGQFELRKRAATIREGKKWDKVLIDTIYNNKIPEVDGAAVYIHTTTRETVNYTALKTIADNNVAGDGVEELKEYVAHLTTTGVLVGDLATVDGHYFMTTDMYPRLVPHGFCLQKLTPELQLMAIDGHTLRVHLPCMHARALLQLIDAAELQPIHNYNMLRLYCQHADSWSCRKAFAQPLFYFLICTHLLVRRRIR